MYKIIFTFYEVNVMLKKGEINIYFFINVQNVIINV